MNKVIIQLLFFLILMNSCSTQNYLAVGVPVKKNITLTSSSEMINKGKALYNNNCQFCHKLYNVEDFTRKKWNDILRDMLPRTSISDETDILAVGQYIDSIAK